MRLPKLPFLSRKPTDLLSKAVEISAAFAPKANPVMSQLKAGMHPRTLELRNFIKLAFSMGLCREPSSEEVDFYVELLQSNSMPAHAFFKYLVESPEYLRSLAPLHHARLMLIKKLPAAEVIVDLGGSTPHSEEGALYLMEYEPKAKRLIIIDLPPEDRFGEFKKEGDTESPILQYDWGTVEYWYRSLAELDRIEEHDFADLVWSGNSIEHVTEEEGDRMIEGAYRMLKPGGHFCLDTPNRLVTEKVLRGALSHPDHKLEYVHDVLAPKLEKHGFEIVEAFGVVDCSGVDMEADFSIPVQVSCPPFTDDIDQAFLLYYHCIKPE